MRPLSVDAIEQQLREAIDAESMTEIDRLLALLDVLDDAERDRRNAVTLGAAAQWYAEAGLRVFPLQPASKLPYTRSRGCHDATDDASQVGYWWQQAPLSNVAIATGHRVDVIDIDGPTGVRSYATIDALPDVLGKVSTPRAGGLHVYIASDGGGNGAGLLDGVDYRGRGGYVVAPPSVNADGKRYVWIKPLELQGAQ